MSAEPVKSVTITFLGETRRMIEWQGDITAADMVVASCMCDAQIASFVGLTEDDEE